jgi:hypothetical protein
MMSFFLFCELNSKYIQCMRYSDISGTSFKILFFIFDGIYYDSMSTIEGGYVNPRTDVIEGVAGAIIMALTILLRVLRILLRILLLEGSP